MAETEPSQVAIELLSQRSREALVEQLNTAFSTMAPDELVAFLADLLLTAGADRDHLKARLASLLSTQFGRRSEKSSADQMDLFAVALRVAAQAAVPTVSAPSVETPTETPTQAAARLIERTNAEIEVLVETERAQRKAAQEAKKAAQQLETTQNPDEVPWPGHLPVREETLPVPPAHQVCDDCQQERQVIRHETSWRIEYKTTAEVVVTRLPVVACKSHHGGPLATPVPPKPVDKGQMGFSLAARLLWLRTTHNLPVHRLAEMMQSEGLPVSEPMIHTLIRTSGERAKPLWEALQKQVHQAKLVNLDDTPTLVLEGETERRRKQARVWLALGDERFAFFFSTQSWKEKDAEKALGPITGVLQGDGYKGFPRYAGHHGLTLAGCLAHLRSKLRKAVQAKDPRATQAMALVQGLYRVEELARLQNLDPEGRLRLRQERSVPMMKALIEWAEQVQPTIETGSPLGKAWTYLSNQLGPLQVFLGNGIVSIDNLAAERGLRRVAIGRRLWLFFRDHDKLEHVCRLMSILYTGRLQGVDELAYLGWVLERLAEREWTAISAQQLLPAAWLALQKKEAEEVGAGQG